MDLMRTIFQFSNNGLRHNALQTARLLKSLAAPNEIVSIQVMMIPVRIIPGFLTSSIKLLDPCDFVAINSVYAVSYSFSKLVLKKTLCYPNTIEYIVKNKFK